MVLIRDGEKGRRGMEVGEEGEYYTYRYSYHHQNDSCIKMGSDESPINSNDFNPFIATPSAPSLGKRPIKVPSRKPLNLFCPLLKSNRKDFYQHVQY